MAKPRRETTTRTRPPRSHPRGSGRLPAPAPVALPGPVPAPATPPRPWPNPTVTIVVPTYNEAGNIDTLLDRIDTALAGPYDLAPAGSERDRLARGSPAQNPTGSPATTEVGGGLSYEVIVVDDDSADGTWRLAEARSRDDQRIRVVRRVGQRGLSSAVMAGMALGRGQVLVVIDADLQHDERRIPDLTRAVLAGADVALGSRRTTGGGYGPFDRRRLAVSRAGASLARWIIGVTVSDPMSGFFAVSRPRYDELAGTINPRGFKILLEFLARGTEPQVEEIGYVFRSRAHGSTKLNPSVGLAFVASLFGLAFSARIDRHRRGQLQPSDQPKRPATESTS